MTSLRFLFRASLGILFSGLLSGCATIIFGSTQKITIDSEPSGADVFVSGKPMGKAPLEIEVPRNREFLDIVLIPSRTSANYAKTRVDLEDTFGVTRCVCTSLVNICSVVGIFGLFADPRTDANFYYKESEITVPLLMAEENQMLLYGGNVILTNENGK